VNSRHDDIVTVTAIAPRTREFIKNGLGVFERGKSLLQDSVPRFVFTLSQSSEIVLKLELD